MALLTEGPGIDEARRRMDVLVQSRTNHGWTIAEDSEYSLLVGYEARYLEAHAALTK